MRHSLTVLSLVVLPLVGVGTIGTGVPLSASGFSIPEDELLDVGIQVLDPGTDKRLSLLSGYEYINPQLRNSEAAFLAVHLMRTLQETEPTRVSLPAPAHQLEDGCARSIHP